MQNTACIKIDEVDLESEISAFIAFHLKCIRRIWFSHLRVPAMHQHMYTFTSQSFDSAPACEQL